jgi:sortase (surface protein transpeptidase)
LEAIQARAGKRIKEEPVDSPVEWNREEETWYHQQDQQQEEERQELEDGESFFQELLRSEGAAGGLVTNALSIPEDEAEHLLRQREADEEEVEQEVAHYVTYMTRMTQVQPDGQKSSWTEAP